MLGICNQIVEHPSAWTRASTGGKAGFTHRLSAQHLSAIDTLLGRTKHRHFQDITRADFDHPLLNDFIAELRRQLMEGHGAVLVAGLTPDRYTKEDFERVFWGFGTHLGVASVQSHLGDRLGYVEKIADNSAKRGYTDDRELKFHCDSYEIAGLMGVRQAEAGGYSRLVSAVTLHNEILRARPEILAPLYEGYYYAVAEGRFADLPPVTAEKIPIFYHVDGKISVMYSNSYIPAAAEKRGESLPPALKEAIDYFVATTRREDLFVEFLIDPGEMLIWHNFTCMHARTAFQDSAEKKRLLLRLWLTVPQGRPVGAPIHQRAEVYAKVHAHLQAQKALA